MGVVGLLSYVKKACYEGNLSEFKAKTLLIDVSCLLHRGIFGCAGKLAIGQETELYIGYVNKFVKCLLAQNCHPILVFDGRPLPAKKCVDDSRRESREKYQRLGAELMSQGLTAEAHRAFGRGTTLTREVIEKTIRTFNKVPHVDIIVAPYEADAQIAYLMQEGFAHAVITEDSDLIVYGCEKIIFKMDPTTGYCIVYEKEKLPSCVCPMLRNRFEFDTFRRICILAGCDYLLGGLQGVGLKTAEEVFTKASKTTPIHIILSRLQLYTAKRLKVKVDKEFIEAFIRAENTFLYQIVFDPIKREQRPLTSLGSQLPSDNTAYPDDPAVNKENLAVTQKNKTNYNYAGKVISAQKAIRFALGNEDVNRSILEDDFTLPMEIPVWSIWHSDYKNLLEREKGKIEKNLKEKFGAFMPKKSPIKRPALSPISSYQKNSLYLQENEIETNLAKKRRFSDIMETASPRNGVYMNWTAKDWMRIYGQEDNKDKEPKCGFRVSPYNGSQGCESQCSGSQSSKSSNDSAIN